MSLTGRGTDIFGTFGNGMVSSYNGLKHGRVRTFFDECNKSF